MSIVRGVLKRPYTVVAVLILICILGIGAAMRTPVDIFPDIDIPVVAVVWTYAGMDATDIQNRILTLHERQMPALVDDISRIEATSYEGVGVEKVFLHEGADVTRAVAQLASSALVVLKYMPPSITPPLVLRYGATDVPIIQLSLSSKILTDTKLNDIGQNIIRPDLAVVHGAEVPYPYGGKPREIMVDLDQQALESRGLSPSDISKALAHQNVILPAGDVKIGSKDYLLSMNSSPDLIKTINAFPVKQIGGRTVFLRDVAHVHDGYQVQTNSVSVNGTPGALITVRKTGGVSTLAVINGLRKALPQILKALPKGVTVKALFDQSVFVKAALDGVIREGAMAAFLAGMMILIFLGNWRLTLIVMASIPLSIITAVLVMYIDGQTLNTMTLGGFSLAVGILVDNGTVVIENIERHLHTGGPLETAIIGGAGEVGVPTFLSTLCICIVFVPVFLLQGTAKYLFSPLSLSVCVSLIASLGLSFTLVPVLFKYLMRSAVEKNTGSNLLPGSAELEDQRQNFFTRFHQKFDAGFEKFRETYRQGLEWTLSQPRTTIIYFVVLMVFALCLFPQLGRDFFPQVDAGQMRLHVRCPPGTRIEQTQADFARVEEAIRQIVGNQQIEVILDNIGLPYSGINIALSDSATVGPMDGEILVSLKKKHSPTNELMATLRQELPRRFAGRQFFFQPADIVDQVLNFGQPAPIDIRVSGPDDKADYELASRLARALKAVPGVVDSHVFQVPDSPALGIDINRTLATEFGINQSSVARNVLVYTNSSAQTVPNFWVDPHNGVSYPLVVQMPTYRINSSNYLRRMPVTAAQGNEPDQLLTNIAKFQRRTMPLVLSQYNIQPVYDVNANVQGVTLSAVTKGIEKVIAAHRPPASKDISVVLSGQAKTMRESYNGLFGGMALAIVLVYLFLVMNFQSWLDPLIVLMAVPFSLGGVMWMLYLTRTPLSVPALMGTLMCIGLTTANSILVVTFANQRMAAGDGARQAASAAGFTRLRPVLMTAGAMILGMLPMALSLGEGGEQNAPLARAVIGGLVFATFATLVFVPTMYYLLRREPVFSTGKQILSE
ncbi:MAG: efflux RND transporter permease subunit [Syntrophobacteraceae bacterium]